MYRFLCWLGFPGRPVWHTVFTRNPQNRQKVPKIGYPFLTTFSGSSWQIGPCRRLIEGKRAVFTLASKMTRCTVFSAGLDSLGGQSGTPFSPEIPKSPKSAQNRDTPPLNTCPGSSRQIGPCGLQFLEKKGARRAILRGETPHFWPRSGAEVGKFAGNFPESCF